ncbi:hypothetical protein BC830DRAFT_1208195 [Chytriomyces sp. MP71]|nr:hypothetical protein BC830DRAFT_1208195 [Chytriomyces sp. MP71]
MSNRLGVMYKLHLPKTLRDNFVKNRTKIVIMTGTKRPDSATNQLDESGGSRSMRRREQTGPRRGKPNRSPTRKPTAGAQDLEPFYIEKHDSEHRVVVSPQPATVADPIADTTSTLQDIFSSLPGHPHRFAYALAGLLFAPKSPAPFGGARMTPGYVSFTGPDAAALLPYIVQRTYASYATARERRVLDFVCRAVNRVLALHAAGLKDQLDERVMQGMRKAGHLPWTGAALMPEHLRHLDTEGAERTVTTMEFSVQRTAGIGSGDIDSGMDLSDDDL